MRSNELVKGLSLELEELLTFENVKTSLCGNLVLLAEEVKK